MKHWSITFTSNNKQITVEGDSKINRVEWDKNTARLEMSIKGWKEIK